LVANMEAVGLLADAPDRIYVELGAGKGWLSAWLAGVSGARRLVLLDRQTSFTLKADTRLRHTALTRATADLRDVDLTALLAHHMDTSERGLPARPPRPTRSKQQQQQQQGDHASGSPPQLPTFPPLPNPAPFVALGKHLCGAATDMALRACLAARQQQQQQQQEGLVGEPGSRTSSTAAATQHQFQLNGFAVATCCHHRCSWRTFVGKRALAAFGITPWEFEALVWCSSWALCGHTAPAGDGGEGGDDAQEQEEDGTMSGTTKAASSTPAAAGWDAGAFHPAQVFRAREERVAFGLRCKRLMDAARAARLAEESSNCSTTDSPPRRACLVEYIDSSVSGECTALIWA